MKGFYEIKPLLQTSQRIFENNIVIIHLYTTVLCEFDDRTQFWESLLLFLSHLSLSLSESCLSSTGINDRLLTLRISLTRYKLYLSLFISHVPLSISHVSLSLIQVSLLHKLTIVRWLLRISYYILHTHWPCSRKFTRHLSRETDELPRQQRLKEEEEVECQCIHIQKSEPTWIYVYSGTVCFVNFLSHCTYKGWRIVKKFTILQVILCNGEKWPSK